jgi:hypothetical protein
MLSAQILGDRGKESIPPIIAYGSRLNLHQNPLDLGRLLPVFLEKLPHQLPANLVAFGGGNMPGKVSQAHGLVLGSHGVPPISVAGRIRNRHFWDADLIFLLHRISQR